ncbi:divalent metal cation transporter [Thalassoroseus pseudoceratinae]|uniref:divalent metal cation transporter n=1 Tax=Thalassoroseus pseudoceratinae TaxID=2713176 RepID=UPI001421C905|nr:divalent metal cation transporter [Thalassoroseus pseudoceratinae]
MSDSRDQAEIENPERIEHDRQMILDAKARGPLAKLWAYTKLSGPGWLQSAITLGGGSLGGSLYLGVLAGFGLLWLQPIAMAMGIIMLSAIGYVALSTKERPFQAINRHINPALGWGWLLATIMANMVWCMPQFGLGTAAIQQNLAPELLGEEAVAKAVENAGEDATANDIAQIKAETKRKNTLICVAILFFTAGTVVWFYNSGGWGIKLFELILKGMVGTVVLCFFGVVIKMSTEGVLDWSAIGGGFIPDFSLLNKPAAAFAETLGQTGDFEQFWTDYIVNNQQKVMITAAATAVGINMTFLLPYSMLARGWDKDFRGLAIFDLSTGLLIPFMLATSCVVIAASSQFHGQPAPGFLGETDPNGNPIQPAGNLVGGFKGLLDTRLKTELGEKDFKVLKEAQEYYERTGVVVTEAEAILAREDDTRIASLKTLATQTAELKETRPEQGPLEEARDALPEADRRMAAMLVKRDAFNLAKALEPLAGKGIANYAFGIGVLGMAISTIIILMLINGFAICEAIRVAPKGTPHRVGALLAGLSGMLGPFVFAGEAKFWLTVPTSMFGMMLLPIAYLTFFLMMNSKTLLGDRRPTGFRRFCWNILMLLALSLASFGSYWSIKTSDYPEVGFSAMGIFLFIILLAHLSRRKNATEEA